MVIIEGWGQARGETGKKRGEQGAVRLTVNVCVCVCMSVLL